MSVDTSWITEGAEVVVYRDAMDGARDPVTTTVAKVAAKSFTLDGIDQRISLDGLSSKVVGMQYSGYRYRVIPCDSDKAAALYAAEARQAAMGQARMAVDKWQRARTRANRLAAIEALQAVED